jgi:hypothetical protein
MCMWLVACEPPPVVVPDAASPVPGIVLGQPITTRNLTDVVVTHAGEGGIDGAVAVGTNGGAWLYDGAAWTEQTTGTSNDLEAVDSAPAANDAGEVVFAVGDHAWVRRNIDGVWTNVGAGTLLPRLFGVWARSADEAFAVGENASVWRYINGTLTSLSEYATVDRESRVAQTDANGNVIRDENGIVIERIELLAVPLTDDLKGVGQVGGSLLMVGGRGAVYEWTLDSTERFRVINADTNRPFTDVFTGAGVWATTTDGVLARRNDEGFWDDDTRRAPAPTFLQSVWGPREGNLFAVGLSPELLEWRDDRWRITPLPAFTDVRGIDGTRLPSDSDDEEIEFMAVGAGGLVLRGPKLLPNDTETLLRTDVADEADEDGSP